MAIQLLSLHDKLAAGSLTKADLMLERIKSGAFELIAPDECENFLIALSQTMDEAYRRRPFDLFWVNSLWDRAERLIPLLLSRLSQTRRQFSIEAMFAKGRAVGWLTSLFRHEMFAHGRVGDRQSAEEQWLFSDAELDGITEVMLSRYRAMSASELFRIVNRISLLFAWQQGGDEQGPRKLVEEKIKADEGLIDMLEHLTSAINSSDRGRFDVLKKDNLMPFMDYEGVRQRINDLKSHDDLGERARRLASAFDDGTKF